MKTKLDLISIEELVALGKNFRNSSPFNHLILDDFLSHDDATQISSEFPAFDDPIWYSYNNPLEIKKATNNWNAFKTKTYQFFCHALSTHFTERLSSLLGIKLYPDIGLHGGGFHTHKAGGKLNPHLDYSIHPKLGLQRRVNLILYITPNWSPDFGGAFGLWEKNSTKGEPALLAKEVDCLFNRAVIFDTTQDSWHGICNEIKSPDGITRNSLATYYLAEPKDSADPRMKVQYAPTENQKGDPKIEELIEKRASIDTFSTVYSTNKTL
jgi:hypothetical protein